MQDADFNSNPLIRSVLHTSFRNATQNLGFAEIQKERFKQEIAPYLKTSESLFDDSDKTLEKLWQTVMRGEVIVAEMANDVITFYVRGRLGQRAIDVRLICHRQDWHVDAVTSMYHLPFSQWRFVYRGGFVAALVCAAVIGYAVHVPHAVTAKVSSAKATNSLQTLAPSVASGQNTTNIGNTSNTAVGTSSNGTNAVASPSTSNTASNTTTNSVGTPIPPPSTLYTFTLKHGMSIHDISVFLHAHNLIHEAAVDFDLQLHHAGIDRTIRPGSYTFKSGMTQNQILSVLRAGPSKSSK